MNTMLCRRIVTTAAIVAAGAGSAFAQPKLVVTGNSGNDLTPDGNTAAGLIFDQVQDYNAWKFVRGTGHVKLGTRALSGTSLFISADSLKAGGGVFNTEGFAGFSTSADIIGRWTSGGDWVNTFSFPDVGGLGAAECGDINSLNAMSADGRFFAGTGHYGTFGGIDCVYRPYMYDAVLNTYQALPMRETGFSPAAILYFVSNDGKVTIGYDSAEAPDPAPGVPAPNPNARALAVWERSDASLPFPPTSQTILDAWGGGQESAMNRAGTIIASSMSEPKAQYVLGDASKSANLFKYVKNIGTGQWDMTDLGRCVDRMDSGPCVQMAATGVSADGLTIVGGASYGSVGFFGITRAFIWRPSINGGVPIDLQDYLDSVNGGPFPSAGVRIGAIFGAGLPHSLSDDGNAMLVPIVDDRNTCLNSNTSHYTGEAGILYLNGAAIPCDQPRIAFNPVGQTNETYDTFGVSLNAFVSGTWPLNYQWQKEGPAGVWTDLPESCNGFDPSFPWAYEGVKKSQLRISKQSGGGGRDGNYRCVVNNSCGSVTTTPATVNFTNGACCYFVEGTGVVCAIQSSDYCTAPYWLGGDYLGNGTTCSPAVCDTVTGACCYVPVGTTEVLCVIDISSHCILSVDSGGTGGAFAGVGTACSPSTCATVTGACCYAPNNQSDVVCNIQIESFCIGGGFSGGLSGVYLGNGATCSPTACASVSGACCYTADTSSNSVCTIQVEAYCVGLNNWPYTGLHGNYRGNGTTCSPTDPCPAVTGACCYSVDAYSNAICTIQPRANCRATVSGYNPDDPDSPTAPGLGGVYIGDGTTCAASPCDAVIGACCYNPYPCPVCTLQTQARCANDWGMGGLGGTFGGPGTTCSPSACPVTNGACCTQSNSCVITCEDDCIYGNGGTFRGAGTSCSPDPCAVPAGTCCRGTTCNTSVGQVDCIAPGAGIGATYAVGGLGNTCNVLNNRLAPCCYADFNKTAGVTAQDIFDFLTAWFAGSPYARYAGDGTGGAPTAQSIFDFLAAWFLGPCPAYP